MFVCPHIGASVAGLWSVTVSLLQLQNYLMNTTNALANEKESEEEFEYAMR